MQGWQYGKGLIYLRPIFWLSLGIIFSLSLTSYVDLNSIVGAVIVFSFGVALALRKANFVEGFLPCL